MFTEKKDDALNLKIKKLAKDVRERVKNELLKEYEKFKSQGRYPYEGLWLSSQDIEKLQERLKKRDRIVFVEVLTVLFIFSLFSYVFYRLMRMVLLP